MPSLLKLAVVVPVYGNEGEIENLLNAMQWLDDQLKGSFETIFVVDGSPDKSLFELEAMLPNFKFKSSLVNLTRNFGSFSAIRTGLSLANATAIGVMAADLQEPKELMLDFLRSIEEKGSDVVFGVRSERNDPALSSFSSDLFWKLYRRFVAPEIPEGGVDIFAVTPEFRDKLLMLNESNSSLISQLFWIGGNRDFAEYIRAERLIGTSSWTFKKKLKYLNDSVFSFTDLPVKLLVRLGVIGLIISVVLGSATVAAKYLGEVPVPGYALTMLTILFFGALNSLGLGFVGNYAWRAYENTKQRPLALTQSIKRFNQ